MSIRFRKDRNKWERSEIVNGKRKRLLFDTEKEAAFKEHTVKTTQLDPESITIQNAINIYFEAESKGKSRPSMFGEKRIFNLMGHFFIVEQSLTYLNEIRYSHCRALQVWLELPRQYRGKKMDWKSSTVNRAFHSIKDFFVYFVRDGAIPFSPCAHLESLAEEPNPRRPMTLEEFKATLEKTEEWFRPALCFIHETASAPSSIERLNWGDIDLEKGQLIITRRKGRGGKWRRIAHPITETVREILLIQKSLYPLAKPSDAVFRNESGGRLLMDWCSEVGNRAIKAAGLRGVVLYGMRHALASDLTDANVNLEIIRQLMGHANIRTTQNYTKPKTESLASALRLVRDAENATNVPPKSETFARGDTRVRGAL